ncbi:CPBP family intramembrane glutamic endopeptidase [Limosilactobacillus fermentum]|uniref:CPBP family intramembrane glutamic endopeptidase n=1 Tax=Limosilactobacillus fermentum TaxID=1613 RepID=UPI000E48839F|nr:type II CAAX endopeptidase family protein [Limosilactobacillus fermentum]KAB1962166.1 CPBP family intramembrane metalloprotease [Limosilactobacillus fermentum]MCH5383771.1 CPBP family intramembrane metalloprotease [Limosilactobacillus fermentum]RGU85233.1 CPBP family intramembrane metalloprotease [Limosilactobacillus fermentum]
MEQSNLNRPWLSRRSVQQWLTAVGYLLVWILIGVFSQNVSLVVGAWLLLDGFGLWLLIVLWWQKPLANYSLKQVLWPAFAWGGGIVTVEVVLILAVYLVSRGTNANLVQNTNQLVLMVKQMPLMAVYILVIAPILEELVFRVSLFERLVTVFHWFLGGTTRFHKSLIAVAALVTALLFAQVHSGIILPQYVLISLILQYLYCHYRNPWVNIFAHIGLNFLTLGFLLI